MRITILLLALLFVACGAPGATSPPDAELDAEGSWQLTSGSVDGVAVPIVDGHRITLIITGRLLGGVAACNSYGGELVAAGGGIRIQALSQTEMACQEPAMESEASYLGGLNRIDRISRDGEELLASGPGVELRYAALPPPPTAELLDTTWVLDGLITGDVVASPMGDPATLELRFDGTFAGSTGCRTFEGEWLEVGDRIDTPRWGMDEAECPAALAGQDAHVVTVIEGGFTPVVDGDRLTITDQDGTGLVYRAQD